MSQEKGKKAAELSDMDMDKVAGGTENDNALVSITVGGVKVYCGRNIANFSMHYYQGAQNNCAGYIVRSDLNNLAPHFCDTCQCFGADAGYQYRYTGGLGKDF